MMNYWSNYWSFSESLMVTHNGNIHLQTHNGEHYMEDFIISEWELFSHTSHSLKTPLVWEACESLQKACCSMYEEVNKGKMQILTPIFIPLSLHPNILWLGEDFCCLRNWDNLKMSMFVPPSASHNCVAKWTWDICRIST